MVILRCLNLLLACVSQRVSLRQPDGLAVDIGVSLLRLQLLNELDPVFVLVYGPLRGPQIRYG